MRKMARNSDEDVDNTNSGGLDFTNHISGKNIKLVILRVHGVSTDTILQVAPVLQSFVGHQLCVDYYLDRDVDIEKVTEAIFEKLFGYIIPSDPNKHSPSSNDMWNTRRGLAANQIPTHPPSVNQNPPDGGSLAECILNDNASARTADDAPCREATEPERLRERMEEERERERTVEMLRGAYSKSQTYPENQEIGKDNILQSKESSRFQNTLHNQDRVSPQISVEESLQTGAGGCTIPSPTRVIPPNMPLATAVVTPAQRSIPASGSLSQSNQSYSRKIHAQVATGDQTTRKSVTDAMLNHCCQERHRAIQRQQEQRVPPLNSSARLEVGFAAGPPADMETSPSHDGQNEKVKNLPEEVLEELSVYLDPPRHGMKNWRCFASFMGIKCPKIDYLESKGDPTRAMLKLCQFRNCTVREFKDLCLKYERFDVLEDVFEQFGY